MQDLGLENDVTGNCWKSV